MPVGPVALVLLAGAGDGERCGRHVVGHSGPGGDICALPDVHGRDEIGVAADKRVVVNDGAGFFHAVIVDRDRAAAEVDVFAYVAVADVGQVGDLRAVADGGVLDLHKIAAAHVRADTRTRTDVGEGADGRVRADLGIVDLRGVDARILSDLHVFQIAVRADHAAVGDGRRTAQHGPGQQLCPGPDEDGRLNIGVVIVPDRHACGGQIVQNAPAEHGLPLGQLLHGRNGVNAVAVGIGNTVLLHEVGEDERIVQRVHQRLTAHGAYAAFDRCAGKRFLVDGKRVNDGGASDDDDVLLLLVGRGQKDVELVGSLLELRAAQLAAVREAVLRLGQEPLVADQKETPDPARGQRTRQPRQQRRPHDRLQHHRAGKTCFRGIVRHKDDGRQIRQQTHAPSPIDILPVL